MTTETPVPVEIKHLDFDPTHDEKPQEKTNDDEPKVCSIPVGKHPVTKESLRCGAKAAYRLEWSIDCCVPTTFCCIDCWSGITNGTFRSFCCHPHQASFDPVKALVSMTPVS